PADKLSLPEVITAPLMVSSPATRSTIFSSSSITSFFFSSRRRHTRFSRDWSSDVCSSDLEVHRKDQAREPHEGESSSAKNAGTRSEERRVGKECRSRWSRYHMKK